MGDADVGASALDAADAGGLAASRALMEGGSLPPRKRLLAGLKQNGWLSSSPSPAEEFPAAGGYASAPASVGAIVRSGSGKFEEGCMGCNAVESNGLRRIKRGGVSLRLCSACTLLYSRSMFCPHCLVMYHDATLLGDPSMWLVCTRCRRSVHPECEQKHSGSKPDTAAYVCLDCVNSARRQREINGVTGMRSKHSSGRPVPNLQGETGSGASPVDFVSPALKKPRLHRERSSRPGDHERSGDGSRFERRRPSPDTPGGTKASILGPPRKVSSQGPPSGATPSPQEAAAAAKNAATAAAKVAAAAKANAAVKAGAAVRAAAAAKAALEAAALAAKAEAACRAELRRKIGNSESRLAAGGGAMRLEINVHSEPRRERSSRGEMKYEGDEAYPARRAGAGSVDDEELARQLHRVINSSPRISRSMTPMRRKNPSVKPETPSSGVSNSSAETVRARPRTNPSPVETEARAHEHEQHQQQHQFRHQQTRPRSITHKEFRRIDTRVSRQEGKPANEGSGQGVGGVEPSSQQDPTLSHMSDGQAAEEPAVRTETMDGVVFAPVGVPDETSILFDALVEVDGQGMHAASGGQASHDRRPADYLQEILEAAVLSDAGMFNDGTTHVVSDLDAVRPEPGTPEQGLEPLETSAVQSVTAAKDAEGEPRDAVARNATKELAQEVTVAVAGDAVAAEAVDATAGEAAGSVAAEVVISGQNEGNGAAVVQDVVMQEVGSVDATQLGEEDETMPEPSRTSEAKVEESSGGEAAAAEEIRAEADAVMLNTVGAGVPSEETKSDASEREVQAASGVIATGVASQQSG